MELVSIKCEQCSAPLNIAADAASVTCEHCQATFDVKARITADASDFEQQAQQDAPGLIAEFCDFLVHNKKWWLTPIILVILLVAGLVLFLSSAAAPFIYPMM